MPIAAYRTNTKPTNHPKQNKEEIIMPRTINRVELLGRVGVEPEMRYTPSGTPITRLRLATDRPKQDGETETDWHTVICWGKLAEAVNSYVQKGARIYLSGRLQHSSYEDSQGQKRYQTEVHAQEVVFLDSRPASGDAAGEDVPQEDDLPF
jgi:single-strand DNA-binding protein